MRWALTWPTRQQRGFEHSETLAPSNINTTLPLLRGCQEPQPFRHKAQLASNRCSPSMEPKPCPGQAMP